MAARRPYLLIVGVSLLLAACGGGTPKPKTVTSGSLRTAVRTTLTQSEKATLDASIDLGSITMGFAGTGGFAPGKKGEFHAQVSLPLAAKTPFDEVFVGRNAWVRSPILKNGDRWVRAGQIPTLGVGLFPFTHPTDVIAGLGLRGTPVVLGSDTVGGVKTTHYRTQISGYPADAWVDGQNRIRKVKVKVDATTGNQKVEANLTVTLFDFGAPVTVTLPVSK